MVTDYLKLIIVYYTTLRNSFPVYTELIMQFQCTIYFTLLNQLKIIHVTRMLRMNVILISCLR